MQHTGRGMGRSAEWTTPFALEELTGSTCEILRVVAYLMDRCPTALRKLEAGRR